jgi:Zn-dependent metalloprotease
MFVQKFLAFLEISWNWLFLLWKTFRDRLLHFLLPPTREFTLEEYFMNYIHFALTLTVSLLIASPSSAATSASAELMRQSQQRLTGMRETLGLDENHSLHLQSLAQDTQGQTPIRFYQLYHGIHIWGGEVIRHTKSDGTELPSTSALKQDVKVDIEPKLSIDDALEAVRNDFATRLDFACKPVVELVVYPEKTSHVLPRESLVPENKLNAEDFDTAVKGYELAYYVHTELENPGNTRNTDYLVNAHTGAIIEKWDSLLTSAAIGTGKSQYSGTVSLNTNSVASGFELRDLTRPFSGGNVVYNLDHSTYGTGTLYTDADNTWGDGTNFKEDPEPTTSANGQTAAVDAAYGLQAT